MPMAYMNISVYLDTVTSKHFNTKLLNIISNSILKKEI